ncbi:MAG: oligopeptide ABC transporter ATP-binding protein OppF, partial [Steroidobacteraceae bacterium]|nr:oligopeptide ABC transporter ATP-binding protein OppF [Steroidobacteraceae bacterium]
LITHDLGVVAGLADRVAVMYAGRCVEEASTRNVLRQPAHPYTAALLRSMPRIDDPIDQPLLAIPGQPPNPRALPSGCAFHPRCGRAQARCRNELPLLRQNLRGRVACHDPLVAASG